MGKYIWCPNCCQEFTEEDARVKVAFLKNHKHDVDRIDRSRVIFLRLILAYLVVILFSRFLSYIPFLGFLQELDKTNPDPLVKWSILFIGFAVMIPAVVFMFWSQTKKKELFKQFKAKYLEEKRVQQT